VDVIEAGFPWSSKEDFKAVEKIAKEVKRPTICALSHAHPQAIDAAYQALKDAYRKRIHVFLSSSDIHILYQLRKTKEEILEQAAEMVKRAKGYVDDVEFSPMDATRTDPNFLHKLLETVIDAGATTVNIPDTVGYTIPKEFCEIIKGIFKNVPNIDKAVVSVHCHNDLGLAVANSLAVLDYGVRQVECTVNGIGERAGNAALEEIVMAIKTRQDLLPYYTEIDTTQIYKTSRLVSELTGIIIQPNKAIVGANAFRHQSGIHQDGILKKRITYEIIDPESVGAVGTTLTLGKLSGRHALRKRFEELGYDLSEDELKRAFAAFKELAEKKKGITDRDLEVIASEELRAVPNAYRLEQVQVTCGEPGIPTATVRLISPKGEVLTGLATGTGPVDAVYKAISNVIKIPCKLIEFSVQSVTGGLDAIGEVTIKIEEDGKIYIGRGASTDIIVASARAYLNALNKIVRKQMNSKTNKGEAN
ncbi:MAG: 2-isopropylmalate synthase, partial [Candidatus Methanospirareceae archaeon]